MRDPRLTAYLDARAGPVPAYLLAVERNTHLRTVQPQMRTSHAQGRLLAWLTGWLRDAHPGDGAFRVLEVGTFTGYGALCLAERLLPGDEVHTLEIDDEREGLIREHIALAGFAGTGEPRRGPSVHLHLGDANTLIAELPYTWNLAYLDARKEDYPRQFGLVAERLAPGGHILLDNVLWDGQVLDDAPRKATARLLRDFTLRLARDAAWETLPLAIDDGLLLVRRAGRAAGGYSMTTR